MKEKKPVLLYCFANSSSFVRKEIRLLEQDYEILTFEFGTGEKWKVPFTFIHQALYIILNLNRISIFFCQLAGHHSFLPVIFSKLSGKPSVICPGGTDCAWLPEIGYGNFNKLLLRFTTVYSVNHCTWLAPKHESLIRFEYKYDTTVYPVQGLTGLIKDFKTPYTAIVNGYDASFYKKVTEKKENTFITVAAGIDLPNTVALKGIDLILQVAAFFPECKFTIVGVPEGFKLKNQGSNITALPEQKHEDLETLYSQHAFYLQLSMSEGFPNAICEAMLCECIPIGSNVNAIPEIIGDTGYILQHRDVTELKELIGTAIKEYHPDKGKTARNRIRINYTEEMRKEKLLALLKQLTLKSRN